MISSPPSLPKSFYCLEGGKKIISDVLFSLWMNWRWMGSLGFAQLFPTPIYMHCKAFVEINYDNPQCWHTCSYPNAFGENESSRCLPATKPIPFLAVLLWYSLYRESASSTLDYLKPQLKKKGSDVTSTSKAMIKTSCSLMGQTHSVSTSFNNTQGY